MNPSPRRWNRTTQILISYGFEARTPAHWRSSGQGGIEPLRFSSATDLKPAHQTTGSHLGETRCLLSGIYTGISAANIKSGRLNYLQVSPFVVDAVTDISFLRHFMC
ncbi:hypothetical protein CEXT_354341 [Caerostris extrusa]|uniref:Uncharacterized protein n=1 Tax=Caerostris extrusa TaxID=172846 RepID=A0AAV4Y1Z0_CAEEX|nr:hypothetical protein CEXT_354341 [Caerostris extrusa]